MKFALHIVISVALVGALAVCAGCGGQSDRETHIMLPVAAHGTMLEGHGGGQTPHAATGGAGAMGKCGRIRALVKKFESSSVPEGMKATDALVRIVVGTVEELTRALKSENSEVRARAALTLGMIGPAAAPAVDALIEALNDEVGIVRCQAADALGEIGLAAIGALEPLQKARSDEYSGTVKVAGWSIGKLKDAEVDLRVQRLILQFATGRPTDGMKATNVLVEIGAPAVRRLTGALGNGDSEVRARAALTLGMIGPEAAPAVSALIKALSDEVGIVRCQAADALGEVGPAAKAALPALEKALDDDYSGTVKVAGWSIEKIKQK